jgi:hypothetical protein
MVRNRALLFALGTAVMSSGCGGGDGNSFNSNSVLNNPNGAASNAPKAPNSGDLGVFLTDNSKGKFDHVWIAVKKIDLKLAAGGMRTVFEDSRGVGVDLSALRDESGPKYRFINALTLPVGTYVGAQVTLAKNAILFPAKSTSGNPVPFADQKEGTADATLNVEFDPPKVLGTGHDDLVLEFGISQDKEGDSIAAKITPSLGAGLEDGDRNAPFVAAGKIENLKGDVPSQMFALRNAKSGEIPIATSATTALATDAGPFVLAKGQTVEVSGSFDTNTRRFEARSIRLRDPKSAVPSQIAGEVSSIDAKAGSWSMTPKMTRGLLPDSLAISIALAPDAKFFGGSGLAVSKDEFLKSLSAGKLVNVLVDGSYDSEKSRFICTEARLQNFDSQPVIRVSGLVTNPQSEGQTFGLTVSSFEGMMTKPGAAAAVAITATTSLLDETGKGLNAEQFFVALATPKTASIEGVLDSSTGRVLATSVKLSAAPGAAKGEKKKAAATK